MSREVDIAWAAGFLEGEGCFGWYGGKRTRGGERTPTLIVNAPQKSREPLDHLARIFPEGHINFVEGNETRNGIWYWRVNGHAAAPVMEELLPHMSTRRQDAILEALKQHYDKQAEIAAKKGSPTCPQGHLWSEHAGYVGTGPRIGKRYCKACQREYMAGKRDYERNFARFKEAALCHQ